jgi:hypothetical protein
MMGKMGKHAHISVRLRAAFVFVLAVIGIGAMNLTSPAADAAAGNSAAPLLPGETVWNGVPSFNFGSNDGVNWDTQYNMDTGPDAAPIQSALKSAGMPIIREWFFQNSLVDNHTLSDAEQLQKWQAVANSGAVCFANLPTGNTVAYDLHLVTLLKGKCELYEVMNEPDIESVNSTQYLAFWNSFVPQARAIDPSARFGGPADYDNQGNECTYTSSGSTCFLQKVLIGMQASGVLPDFVTYHWYPCWNNSASQCLALAGSFASAASQVIGWVQQIFGHALPVICSEWNADPGNPAFMNDRTWDGQYVTAALQSIEQSGLAGAMEYDISEYGNYGADDMFDIYNGGKPFATWTAFAAEIARVRGSSTPIAQAPGSTNPAPPSATSPTPTAPTAPTAPTSPTPPAPPTLTLPARVPFTDGFESGNVGAWTAHQAAGNNTLQAESANVYSGAFAMEMVKQSHQGNVYVEEDMSQGAPSTTVKFALDLSGASGSGMMQLMQMRSIRGYFAGGLWLTYNAATGYRELEVYDGAYHWHVCQLPTQFYDAWHTYSLKYTLGTGTKGRFSLSIDGTVACSATDIATTKGGGDGVSAYQFGSIGSDGSTAMDIKLDAVSIK